MMKMIFTSLAASAFLAGLATVACADIPTIDNSQLDKHSQTQSHTHDASDSQLSTVKNTKGVDCSVHQGSKNADAKDGAASPDKAGAGAALKQYGGDPLSGSGTTQNADGVGRDQAGQVAGQQDASTQDAKTGEETLQGLAQRIGSSDTIKGAYDQNSVLAIQNGMQLNGVIRIANAWVQAINTMNLLTLAQQSGGSSTMNPVTPARCVAGTSGQGTDAQPCRTNACETVEISQPAGAGCIEVRYHDSYNNIVTYLLTVEDAVNFKTQGLVLN